MKKQYLADVSLLLVVFIWGATFVMVQDAIAFLKPFSFNAARFFIASLTLLAGYLLLTHKKKEKVWTKPLVVSGIKIGVWLFLGYAFQTTGLLYTTPAKAGFITGLSVVLVPMFSLLLLKQKIPVQAVTGIILAAIGLYLMTMGGHSYLSIGDVLVFFCAVSFAMQIITTAAYAKLYNALPLTIIQLITVAVLSTVSALLFEDTSVLFTPSIMLRTEVISALLVTSLLATAFAFFAQTHFQAKTSPTRVALIYALEPVFAALTSYVLINEQLTNSAIIGCVLILIGMVTAEFPFKRKKAEPIDSAA